jgi:hypothetical protein
MQARSAKLNFMNRGDSDQDFFDSLIQVEPNEYKPSPMGAQLHMSLARTRIMRGGLGSGKTRCATEHVNNLALMYPGSLHFIGRKDITSLKVTTQKEFLEFVVRPETIQQFNVNENTLYYKNGSQILFRETKDPNKVKSLQLTSYLLDESDENESDEIWEKLDERLRQKVYIDGKVVIPPYAGLLVFNPTDEEHWLYHLAQRRDIDLVDFRFDTEDNAHNLPPDYIPNLRKRLAPWDVNRLIHGHWGRSIKGKPVYHGFTDENNVRTLRMREDLPLLRGWDYGYGHPAVRWAQFDPEVGRYTILREYLGSQIKLHDVVKEVHKITRELVGPGYPIFDYGDPHGADEKDVGVSSIEYLRIHHGIHVNHRRERVKTGMEEIQEKILTKAPLSKDNTAHQESLFLVDRSCKITIAAYMGGYHRDQEGKPNKDGFYDHLPDTDRYIIVNNMNRFLSNKFKGRPRYRARNAYTGY